jgi:hypothetical protein
VQRCCVLRVVGCVLRVACCVLRVHVCSMRHLHKSVCARARGASAIQPVRNRSTRMLNCGRARTHVCEYARTHALVLARHILWDLEVNRTNGRCAHNTIAHLFGRLEPTTAVWCGAVRAARARVELHRLTTGSRDGRGWLGFVPRHAALAVPTPRRAPYDLGVSEPDTPCTSSSRLRGKCVQLRVSGGISWRCAVPI